MPLRLWTGIPPHFALTWWPAPRELLPLPPPAAQHACGEAPASWAVPAAPTTLKLRLPNKTTFSQTAADHLRSRPTSQRGFPSADSSTTVARSQNPRTELPGSPRILLEPINLEKTYPNLSSPANRLESKHLPMTRQHVFTTIPSTARTTNTTNFSLGAAPLR